MTPRTRALIVLTLGFCACLAAGWTASLPLQEANESWDSVREKLEQSRSTADRLDPADPTALVELRARLAETEELGDARRDEIANSAVLRILISIFCTAIAYLVAIQVSARLTAGERRALVARGVAARAPGRAREGATPDERVFVADHRGQLEFVNDAIVGDLRRSREDLIGTPIAELFGGGSEGAFGAILEGLGPDRPSAHVEVSVGDSAEPTWIALDLHARFDGNGAIREIVGSGRDVTAARRTRDSSTTITGGTRAASPDPSLDGRRILIASGRADERRLIEFYLQQAGARVEGAGDQDRALAVVDGSAPFDLVIVDRGLPGDGALELVRDLRKAGRSCPIILLAHETRDVERNRALEAGCTEVMRKPIDRRHLIATLAAILPELDSTH